MRLWRLAKPEHAPGLDGEGARLWGGRWNSPGMPMVYCASSLALAALEVFVNLPPAMRRKNALPPFVSVSLDVEDSDIEDPDLPANLSEKDSRSIGDNWLQRNQSLGMIVPSRVIPLERNVLLNPRHPAMRTVQAKLTQPFVFDDRLTY